MSYQVEIAGKCVICFNQFDGQANRSSNFGVLKCGHLFHFDCVEKTLQAGLKECIVCNKKHPAKSATRLEMGTRVDPESAGNEKEEESQPAEADKNLDVQPPHISTVVPKRGKKRAGRPPPKPKAKRKRTPSPYSATSSVMCIEDIQDDFGAAKGELDSNVAQEETTPSLNVPVNAQVEEGNVAAYEIVKEDDICVPKDVAASSASAVGDNDEMNLESKPVVESHFEEQTEVLAAIEKCQDPVKEESQPDGDEDFSDASIKLEIKEEVQDEGFVHFDGSASFLERIRNGFSSFWSIF